MSTEHEPAAGDLYYWRATPDSYPVGFEVLRIMRGGKKAEVRCIDANTGAVWTKAQPLPFPDSFIFGGNPLTEEHDAVTAEFTDAQWKRVEAMPTEKANAYLRRRADYRREKRGDGWWLL